MRSCKYVPDIDSCDVTDNFQSYDYGPVGNYEHYKQKTPISYDLGKVIAPMVLFHSSNDLIVKKTVGMYLFYLKIDRLSCANRENERKKCRYVTKRCNFYRRDES